MQYTQKIKEAIRVAIRVHELDQKQKRKGKDIPYIIHPLIVGLILARISRDEDVVVAGILHDTIEDSVDTKKVTIATIKKRFGDEVARMVGDVTEKNRNVPWVERKKQNVKKIADLPKDSLMYRKKTSSSTMWKLLRQ
ncbi:MAG: metal dependent phosphohydrolase [Parcubacteria group bacterium GW2011_GWA1_47_8]|nr:MAG: metal dependent phosphohydrolase [Parcubacteria group bacterium GW2011_GWA1_47_8]